MSSELKPCIKIPAFRQGRIDSFWEKVAITANPDSCWNWTGSIKSRKKPYGSIRIGRKTLLPSHRVAYYLSYGVDPKEMHVLHKCDNHRCTNPKHLFLGTNADNVADKVSKGRQARNPSRTDGLKPTLPGEKNILAKLTEIQVLSMRGECDEGGISFKELAKKYNISDITVSRIIRRKSWTHI